VASAAVVLISADAPNKALTTEAIFREGAYDRAVRLWALALLAALAALALTSGRASAQSPSAPLTATGTVTVTWQGDPARGCASGALCDVVGSAVLPMDARGRLFAPAGDSTRFFGDLFDSPSGVVRVRRRGAEPTGPGCVDRSGSADVQGSGVRVEPAPARGRVVVVLQPPFDAGRCAGPLPADLGPALPRVTVAAAALRRGDRTLSLRARRAFAAGAYTGSVTSDVALRVGRPAERRTEDAPRARPAPRGERRVELVDVLRLTYEVRAQGRISSSFRGLEPPGCDPLDACGLSGETALTVMGGEGGRAVVFSARATRRGRGRPTVAQLLRAVRAGERRLTGGSGAIASGRVRSSVRREGVAGGCAERSEAGSVGLVPRQDPRGGLAVRLLAYGSGEEGGASPLSTRCPGPEIAANTPLASGRIVRSALGARRLTVRLGATGAEVAPGYGLAARAGEVVLRLGRVRATVTSSRRTRGS
jgi:hypothetical protein